MDSLSASNNNLVQSQLCGRQTVVKREKVYKCFAKNCTQCQYDMETKRNRSMLTQLV